MAIFGVHWKKGVNFINMLLHWVNDDRSCQICAMHCPVSGVAIFSDGKLHPEVSTFWWSTNNDYINKQDFRMQYASASALASPQCMHDAMHLYPIAQCTYTLVKFFCGLRKVRKPHTDAIRTKLALARKKVRFLFTLNLIFVHHNSWACVIWIAIFFNGK